MNKLFVLTNGHEIIGKIVSDEPTYYVVDQPLGIQAVPQQDGSYGLQLIPVCVVNPEGECRVHKHAISLEFDNIPDDVEKAYIQRTSRIQLIG